MKQYVMQPDGSTILCDGEEPMQAIPSDGRYRAMVEQAIAGEVEYILLPEPLVDLAASKLDSLADARYAKEGAGIVWVDQAGDVWVFDSTVDSQNRFTSAVASVHDNSRTGSPVWKCGSFVNGELNVAFRPTDNAELHAIAALVAAHVQKCFEAEALAVAAVQAAFAAGDSAALEAVDYEATFNAL